MLAAATGRTAETAEGAADVREAAGVIAAAEGADVTAEAADAIVEVAVDRAEEGTRRCLAKKSRSPA
jgi:hypothetical protein